MREYKRRDKIYRVYEPGDALPAIIQHVYNWRDINVKVGDWVRTDDNCVLQILWVKDSNPGHEGTRTGAYFRRMIRVVTQMAEQTMPNQSLSGEMSDRPYAFPRTGKKKHIDKLTRREKNFSDYLLAGMPPRVAYKHAFVRAKLGKKYGYMHNRANLLLNTERVQKYMEDKIKAALATMKIDERWVLKQFKEVAEDGGTDAGRIAATKVLGKMLEMPIDEQPNALPMGNGIGVNKNDITSMIQERIGQAVRPDVVKEGKYEEYSSTQEA